MDKQTDVKPVGLSDVLDGFRVGQRVWTTICCGNLPQRMAEGVVVGLHSGYCDVDVMSLHGGAPWIQQHANHTLLPSNAGTER
jgi:hypothetical protein